jgi:alpha-glucosidase (family GH31 glycosyl hydrolase)
VRVGRLPAAACALLALALGSLLTQPARASVTIGPERIEVSGDGADAVITRSPFHVSFNGPHGEAVLAEVPNESEDSLPLERSVVDPASEPDGDTVYSPLSFLVGSDDPSTHTTGRFAGGVRGEYSGDLEGVAETGTEYSARAVLSAEASGEGVALRLSTNDPSGMQLDVSITPQSTASGGAIRLSASPSEPAGVAAMADSFASSAGEAFHGFGGRHDALDQHGREFFNWADQENVTETPELSSEQYLYPDGPEAAYDPQASFVSSAGYGFLLGSQALSRWSLDAARPEAWQTQAAAPSLQYLVAPGTMPAAAGIISAVSGRQPVPPEWALGPMFDREVESGEKAAAYEAQLAEDLGQIEKYKLPVKAYRIEGWAFLRRSALESEIAMLKAMGIKALLYFRSFVSDDGIGTEFPEEFETALSNGYVATEEDGQPYTFTGNFGTPAALIDFTDPAAVAWWKGRIDAALELGAEGFMLDFGEQVLPGMHFHDGSSGAQMHNRYPVVYQRVTREILAQYEGEHPGRKIVFYTRSGYSGEPGSAAYDNFNFPGDETTDWTHASGLASLAPDMLNRGIGGAFGFSTDIGGYLDFYNRVEGAEKILVKPTGRELFLRWAEWAALTPSFRLHGAVLIEHTPWSFKGTVAAYRALSKLHEAAEPLIEELWRQADETGLPVTRPLYLEYPEDREAAKQEQEWLLGPHVLVAPVVEKGAQARSVYFPAGCWRDPETGLEEHGPASATVPAKLAQLPFFFACGTQPFKPNGRFGRHREKLAH